MVMPLASIMVNGRQAQRYSEPFCQSLVPQNFSLFYAKTGDGLPIFLPKDEEMEAIYPAGPRSVPPELTRTTVAYRLQALMAGLSLLLFVMLYMALTAWFVYQTYSLIADAFESGSGFVTYIIAAGTGFLSIFLIKGLFFVRHAGEVTDVEVTPEQEPQLFEFLHRLADEVKAPRPHRVFLSNRVNAAVFYNLTLLNLIFPSRKNLEIGMPLVNALTISEFKAVLAHEFGHFAQRSMAVGRWVYTAQQIAENIIHTRDAMDGFLSSLSRFDFRVAWVGWLLSLIIWSLRSLLDSVFSLVVLAHRSLSREMEFNADRVSVSVTGSDALIHALHRLHVLHTSHEFRTCD